MAGATRGRPKVTEKVTIATDGGEKIVLSYIEDDKRVQVSLPESWNFKTMTNSAGRRRIDLVDASPNGTAPKKVRKPRAKKAAATKPAPEKSDTTEPVKRRRNRKKTAVAA